MQTLLNQLKYAMDFASNLSPTPFEATSTITSSDSSKEITSRQVEVLTGIGCILGNVLAELLDQLQTYNEAATYPIISILEPYFEETPIIDFHIRPNSSREIILEVSREGKAVPYIPCDNSL
jgi:hypothetical protein